MMNTFSWNNVCTQLPTLNLQKANSDSLFPVLKPINISGPSRPCVVSGSTSNDFQINSNTDFNNYSSVMTTFLSSAAAVTFANMFSKPLHGRFRKE
uniref:Uncharacterized protein n=1 Tax=Ditylenchus dipsaci TaxID=166011 RepID=A0A915CZ89_9BILA